MNLFLDNGNWTEDGKLLERDLRAALAPVFEHWLQNGADRAELYRLAMTAPVFNAWQEAMQKVENQHD
jgi:hypothetical protein